MNGEVDAYIGEGDRRPYLVKRLVDLKSKQPIPLEAGDTVAFYMSKLPDKDVRIGGACNIRNLAAAEVEYQWQEGDTDDPGSYEGEFTVTYSDGAEFTIPNYEDKVLVVVTPSASPPLPPP